MECRTLLQVASKTQQQRAQQRAQPPAAMLLVAFKSRMVESLSLSLSFHLRSIVRIH